jgi:hypothetical protein
LLALKKQYYIYKECVGIIVSTAAHKRVQSSPNAADYRGIVSGSMATADGEPYLAKYAAAWNGERPMVY